jgi:phosphoribosylanthranilate isomerase
MMRAEDALSAAHTGADAIGMVLYAKAARRVSLDQARDMMAVLPAFVTPVGLFVDSPPDEVRDIARQLNLRHVQLQGNEPPETVAGLRDLKVIKAIHVDRNSLSTVLAKWRAAIADLKLSNLAGVLMETGGTTVPGGSGVENDWVTIAAAQAAGAFDGLPPLIAAGGLTPANVGNVVTMLRPWSVDVSSGIEASRGIKSNEKMTAFIDAVRNSDGQE